MIIIESNYRQYLLLFILNLVMSLGLLASEKFNVNKVVVVEKVTGKSKSYVERPSGKRVLMSMGFVLVVGDTVHTGKDSTVDLRLSDGSIVRLSSRTIYKIKKIEKNKSGFWHWAFELGVGQIRALVKTAKQKGFIKFTVDTPTGSIGVRGTEFVLRYDSESRKTTLITISGEVLIRSPESNFTDQIKVRSIKAGQQSEISEKDDFPSLPKSARKSVQESFRLNLGQDYNNLSQKQLNSLEQNYVEKIDKQKQLEAALKEKRRAVERELEAKKQKREEELGRKKQDRVSKNNKKNSKKNQQNSKKGIRGANTQDRDEASDRNLQEVFNIQEEDYDVSAPQLTKEGGAPQSNPNSPVYKNIECQKICKKNAVLGDPSSLCLEYNKLPAHCSSAGGDSKKSKGSGNTAN